MKIDRESFGKFFDGTPGKSWDDYAARLKNAGAGEVDDRGYSLADEYDGNAEGGPFGPAMPTGAADLRKAQASQRRRQKEAYSLLTLTMEVKTQVDYLRQNHFQDGRAAFIYMDGAMASAINRTEIRAMNRTWDDCNMLSDVGVQPHSVRLLLSHIRALNGDRPAAPINYRKTNDEIGEKLLECIIDASKHFSESATTEYNAVAGQWVFEHPAGTPLAGQRDVDKLATHYDGLWKAAVDAKLPGFHVRAPAKRVPPPNRQTMEAGNVMGQVGGEPSSEHETARMAAAGGLNIYVPRSGSPASSLVELGNAGHDIASRRGTTSTTDWTILNDDELCHAADQDGCDGEFEVACLFDSDGVASVELICDCCRGLGHVKRLCPSNRNRHRSIPYAIGMLQKKLTEIGDKSPRRQPGRGQRPPFQSQPRRFQPRGPGGKGQPPRGRRLFGRSAEEGGSEDDDESVRSTQSSSRSLNSSATGTGSAESAGSARESMRTTFSLSDDQLFERGNAASERASTPRSPTSRLRDSTAFGVLAAVCAVMAAVAAAFDRIGRLGAGTVVIVAILIWLPRARSERALIGGEYGMITTVGGLPNLTVDSGCTSTAVALKWKYLLDEITDTSPRTNMYIADAKPLAVDSIGKMQLPVEGYNATDPTRTLIHVKLPCSRTLVVDGMDEGQILVSTRGLKRDGVNTYLNDDNSIKTSDCLYIMHEGIIIPFVPSGHAYNITMKSDASHSSTEQTVTSGNPRYRHRPLLHIHRALGHSGAQRLGKSNIIIDGVEVKTLDLMHDASSCKGCRLGNSGREHNRRSRGAGRPQSTHVIGDSVSGPSRPGDSTKGFERFGQQIDSDICTGFAPSFPHGLTSMVNFIDRWGHQPFVMLTIGNPPDAHQVASSLRSVASDMTPQLNGHYIGRWVTDNGLSFHGDDVDSAAKELSENRGFNVPNDLNAIPVAERFWGVLERMCRSDLAEADAPECLWAWGAAHNTRLLKFLPTSAHSPPMSPHQFATRDDRPVDLSWARTMYCDVTVTIPERDREGKLGYRGADGCHLGYDSRRSCHLVYVESLKRIGAFKVTEWRENSFVQCKRISSDTPVDYYEAGDLPISPVTASMVPKRHRALAFRGRSYTIAILYRGKPRDTDMATQLRAQGHTVRSWEITDGPDGDLSTEPNQQLVLNSLQEFDFIYMCPPCLTTNIAKKPSIREFPDHLHGRPDISHADQQLILEHDANFLFCARVASRADELGKPWAIEGPASRRLPPCAWDKFSHCVFPWDLECIKALNGVYMAFPQCKFSAPWQKYTGLLVSQNAHEPWHRIFGDIVCDCKSHAITLQGYDDVTGKARTAVAATYVPQLCAAFNTAIVDTCSQLDKEGEKDKWVAELAQMSRAELCAECGAEHACSMEAEALKPLSEITDKRDMQILLEAPDANMEMEFKLWQEDAEGAFAISELPSHVELPKNMTLAEAMRHKLWPMIKKAMESEIEGKMLNKAWQVVARPTDKHVLKSRWVFALKLNEDGTIKEVKARFVACGYSQIKDIDYTQIFASTLVWISMRMLLSWIADEDQETDHVDAVKAFTQSTIDHEIYVEMPEGFSSKGFVLLLLKALEGIKQGAYLWYQHNKAALTKLGFVSWTNEPNLYRHPEAGFRAGVFADDGLFGFSKSKREQYLSFKSEYAKLINIGSYDTISPAVRFVGCEIARDRDQHTLTITQRRYCEQLEEEFKGKIVHQETPYGSTKEQRQRFEDLVRKDSDRPVVDRGLFLKICGKLIWPSSLTRPDIAHFVGTITQLTMDPREDHIEWGYIGIGYLVATKNLGITYGGRLKLPLGIFSMPADFEQTCGLHTYHDSSFGTRPRPMGGYALMYNNGIVDWSSKRANLIPDSSREAEQAVASRAVKATLFARMLLAANGRITSRNTPLIGDNKAFYEAVSQEGATFRTRYFERALMLVQRVVLLLLVAPFLVTTDYMAADIFTKATDKGTFFKMRNYMMNINGNLRGPLTEALFSCAGASKRVISRIMQRI